MEFIVSVLAVSAKSMFDNGYGFKQFDILQMKKDRNAKWQIALKPMLSVCIFKKGAAACIEFNNN